MKKHVFFDLDGTLVDTLPDITDALNFSLSKNGFDIAYSIDDTRHFINNGTKVLLARAMGEKSNDERLFDKVLFDYLNHYSLNFALKSHPFYDIKEILRKLKEAGMHLYVFTNKPSFIATPLLESLFGNDVFDLIIGHDLAMPAKPDASPMLKALKNANANLNETCLVGDTLVDIQTAENAGVDCFICSYGYGDYSLPSQYKVKAIVNRPNDLLKILL